MITGNKIQEYIDAGQDYYEIARLLVNDEVSRHCPLSLDDLPDTATVASEIEAIVECLEVGDIQDAINIAIDGARLILEEEGFEIE